MSMEIVCPKCSSAENSYLFCKECDTYYCMACCINYYQDKITTNIIPNHNPECSTSSASSIDLSDYE
jgi:hypothetical protein